MRKLTAAMGDISGLIHSVVDAWRSELPEDGAAVLEAVNMIEPGYSAWVDQTWLVVAEPETMMRRLMQRNSLAEAEARQRLASQRPWSERAAAADLVIHNDGDLEQTKSVVRAAFQRARDAKGRGALPESRYHAWRAAHKAAPRAPDRRP